MEHAHSSVWYEYLYDRRGRLGSSNDVCLTLQPRPQQLLHIVPIVERMKRSAAAAAINTSRSVNSLELFKLNCLAIQPSFVPDKHK